LAILALALASGGLQHEDLWQELTHNLEHEAYRLSGRGVACAIYGAVRAHRATAKLFDALARRMREEHHKLSPSDCARAIVGFLRGPTTIAEQVVFRGPVCERTLQLGFNKFSSEELTMIFDALSRPPTGTWGVESMAGSLLEELHLRLTEFSPEQLASLVRSLGVLQPEAKEVLVSIIDAAQAAIQDGSASHRADDENDRSILKPTPRHVAMLCQGISAQSQRLLPDAGQRLESLLPIVADVLEAKPTAITLVTILGSLARCPASEQCSQVLDLCAKRLAMKINNLTAFNLVSLTAHLAAVASSPGASGCRWPPPPELLHSVVAQLDMKRYDLPQGFLWRAKEKLDQLGAGRELRLEERDKQLLK